MRNFIPHPEVQAFGRLRKKPFPCPHRPLLARELDARADGIAVAVGATQYQTDRRCLRGAVPHQPQPRPVPVAHPEIDIAITVEIGQGDATGVIKKIKTGNTRDVREVPLTGIEKHGVSLAATK